MAKISGLFISVMLTASWLIGCASVGEIEKSQDATLSQSKSVSPKQSETQLEKFQRLFAADSEKLIVGSDNKTTVESIEIAFQPQSIASIDEITEAKLNDPGRPYYFKLRAIYKGYDKDAKLALLQDLGQKKSSMTDMALGAVFGVDTAVYSTRVLGGDAIVATFPTEANAVATFYLIAVRFTENEGRQINETGVFIRFVRDIEKPYFDPAKFIVVNGMNYITVEDAHVPTQQDAMSAYFFGGATGNSSASVFDPIAYPLVDLMDARVAMDKKDRLNDYTFPTIRVKYVSEVLFMGQSGTTITVSTDDNVLTERMSFTGRASTIKNGEKVRVYYTIAKDPIEKWEIQAIERL